MKRLALVLALLLFLGLEYLFLKRWVRSQVALPSPKAEAPPRPQPLPALSRDLPPPEQLTALLSRPPFFEGRKLPPENPPKEEPRGPVVKPPPGPPKLLPVAIVASPETGKMALLKRLGPRPPGPAGTREELLRVKVGDEIEGWRVAAIARDRVVLEGPGGHEELTLFKPHPNRPKVQAAPLPPMAPFGPPPQETPPPAEPVPPPEEPPIPPGGER